MEPMEMVAGGEQPIFIAMKRKSGEELDLVCESGGKRNMKWDFCEAVQGVCILRSWLFDSGAALRSCVRTLRLFHDSVFSATGCF